MDIDLNALATENMHKPKTIGNPLVKKAYDEATISFFKKLFINSMYANFVESGSIPEETKDPKHLALIESSINRTMTKPPFMFITINPTKDISLQMLKKKVEKFTARRIIQKYSYVYEVRSDDEKEPGLHTHMVIRYQNIRPYDFKVAAKNTFKDICDTNNPHCLNFKQITDEMVEDKISYMLGSKKDEKLAGVLLSVNYRKENNLDDIYESSPPFPCRATLIPLEPPTLIRQ